MAALLVGCPEATSVQGVVSRTFTLKARDFVLTPDSDKQNAVARAVYDMREITAEIVDAGTVTAELDLGSKGAEWSALPLTLHFTDGSGGPRAVAIQSGYRTGKFIVLLRADLTGAVAGQVEVNDYQLRVIVIPGRAAGG